MISRTARLFFRSNLDPIKTSSPKLVIFDLDETLYTRYFNQSNKSPLVLNNHSHWAPCTSRQQYFWINQAAWRAIIPSMLNKHDVAFLTASICHDERQIKKTLDVAMIPAEMKGMLSFQSAPYIDGKSLKDRHIPKGERLLDLKESLGFKNYKFSDMVLVDDQMHHLSSAELIGVKTIKAGSPQYFHELAKLLEINVEIPPYETYELGWDSINKRVTLEGVSPHSSLKLV